VKKDVVHNWKAPKDGTLPHFIIGGAMKSGTSTLHHILAQHPKVFIPEEELGFFDIDNIIEHYDFNFFDRKSGEWTSQDMVKDPASLWKWYSSKFEGGSGKLLGEDSTSYLTSRFAAQRISIQHKEIKLIFMLRHPTRRAYSNYQHLVRSGVVGHSFEDVLRFNPGQVLKRSLYRDQLESYYEFIPKENIKVVVFEDLIKDTKAVMTSVCSFLGIEIDELDPAVFETHANVGKFPLFPGLHRLKNRWFRAYGNSFYLKSLPQQAPESVIKRAWFPKFVNRIHGLINPLKTRTAPPINPGTQEFLDAYYKKELSGLDALVGFEILSKWFPDA
jgi:hypothetical protein